MAIAAGVAVGLGAWGWTGRNAAKTARTAASGVPLPPEPPAVPSPPEEAIRRARAMPAAPLPLYLLDTWKPDGPISPRWKAVVVHHTATSGATVEALDRVHRGRGMENGLAYHFVIGNGRGLADGAIHATPRWRRQLDGGHVRGAQHNRVALGVCLVGDFEDGIGEPTDAQVAALKALLDWLLDSCGLSDGDVRGHRDYPGQATLCPGRRLPLADILETRRIAVDK